MPLARQRRGRLSRESRPKAPPWSPKLPRDPQKPQTASEKSRRNPGLGLTSSSLIADVRGVLGMSMAGHSLSFSTSRGAWVGTTSRTSALQAGIAPRHGNAGPTTHLLRVLELGGAEIPVIFQRGGVSVGGQVRHVPVRAFADADLEGRGTPGGCRRWPAFRGESGERRGPEGPGRTCVVGHWNSSSTSGLAHLTMSK